MDQDIDISPWRVLLPVGLGTGLSLIGDSSLYTVLPTHVAEAGVPLASVGILLSANRFIRLAFNVPTGILYDRGARRPLFVAALFLGAASTAIYALTQGFWPLLTGRLLWGLAWVGIWVGGNSIILDISRPHNRGRRVGLYQISFFLGASGGAMLGGFLTDWLGYHQALGIGATLTLVGALIALLFLPETRGLNTGQTNPRIERSPPAVRPSRSAELMSAIGLMGVNRLVVAGMLMSTFGLLLFERIGDSIEIRGLVVGVATLTGLGLGLQALISMVAAPVLGTLSDRTASRWQVAAGGLTPGVAGLSLLAQGSPLAILLGVPMTAITSGSNQGLATAIVGELTGARRQGRQLGWLFTTGDLASAVGPLLAYAVIPLFGLSSIYLANAGLFAVMALVAWHWAARSKQKPTVWG
jgi:MFS family permease